MSVFEVVMLFWVLPSLVTSLLLVRVNSCEEIATWDTDTTFCWLVLSVFYPIVLWMLVSEYGWGVLTTPLKVPAWLNYKGD